MVEIENDKGNQEYEEIILRNVTETLTREELKGKDLVLIRAPAEVLYSYYLLYTIIHIPKFTVRSK